MKSLSAVKNLWNKVRAHFTFVCRKLILKSKTKYFAKGSIIADSREAAKGLMVISSGLVNAELPIDSDEADEENRDPTGKTLLYVFGRGCVRLLQMCANYCFTAIKVA